MAGHARDGTQTKSAALLTPRVAANAMPFDQLQSREFIALLGGATAWPRAARAQQQGKIPRIGIIDDSPMWDAFRQGLRDLGYLEGQNIAFEYRRADGAP